MQGRPDDWIYNAPASYLANRTDLMIALRASTLGKKPRIPGGVRIYAIGDIHGRADLLDDAFKRIDADLETNPISIGIEVYLGDYIDRGPASREVIDRLVARNRTFRTVFLKGNHEAYLTSFAANPRILEDWQQFGGLETLMSYGITPPINAGEETQARLAATFNQSTAGQPPPIFRQSKIVIYVRGFLFRPCGYTARHSIDKAARRGLAVDLPGFSSLRGGIQQDHRSRAYARAEAGYSLEPDQYRHWSLRNGAANLFETGRRSYRFHLSC